MNARRPATTATQATSAATFGLLGATSPATWVAALSGVIALLSAAAMLANSTLAILRAKRVSASRLIKQVSELPGNLSEHQWALIAGLTEVVIHDASGDAATGDDDGVPPIDNSTHDRHRYT